MLTSYFASKENRFKIYGSYTFEHLFELRNNWDNFPTLKMIIHELRPE
jgi:hypothetical protein